MALTHLVDTSALKRVGNSEVRAAIEQLAVAGALARPTICDLEIGDTRVVVEVKAAPLRRRSSRRSGLRIAAGVQRARRAGARARVLTGLRPAVENARHGGHISDRPCTCGNR